MNLAIDLYRYQNQVDRAAYYDNAVDKKAQEIINSGDYGELIEFIKSEQGLDDELAKHIANVYSGLKTDEFRDFLRNQAEEFAKFQIDNKWDA